MDWDLYKALCDRPDVVSRWLLEQTLELVDDADLAVRLTLALNGTSLPRPQDHRGPRELDMLQPALTLADVETLRDVVGRAVAAGRTTTGTRTRGLGGFVEAWDEYRRWLNGRTTAERLPCSARS
jgi:hypothetical protein